MPQHPEQHKSQNRERNIWNEK